MEKERALQREHGDGKVSKTEFDLLKNYVVDVVAKKFNYDHDELGTDQKYWREENSRRHYYRARVWYQNKDGVRLVVYRVMINRVGIADSCAQTIIM